MRYQGGKHHASKHIAKAVLLEAERMGYSSYYEPFLGGANVASQVAQIGMTAYLSDINADVMEMWVQGQQGWVPPAYISKEEYQGIRTSPGPSRERGFAGVACSWGAKFMCTYAPERIEQAQRAFLAQSKLMKGCTFGCHDYRSHNPICSVVYCDPPYEGETAHKAGGGKFDHDRFWGWCEEQVDRGNSLLVSSRSAREGWSIIWEGKTPRGIRSDSETMQVERLFFKGRN